MKTKPFTTPLPSLPDPDQPLTTLIGLILTREQLITVRFEELSPFDTFTNRDLAAQSDPLTSAAVFAGLIDAIADRFAQALAHEDYPRFVRWHHDALGCSVFTGARRV